MNDKSKNVLERIHEYFLMRDISFIFSGGIFITIVIHALNYEMQNYFIIITKNVYSFILFIVSSYFVGIFLYFLAPVCRIVPFETLKPKLCADTLEIYTDINKKFGSIAIRQLEKVLFFRNFGSTIGMGLIIAVFLEVYHYFNVKNFISLLLVVLFLLIGLFFVYIARMHNRSYDSSLRSFGSRLLSEKSNSSEV